MLKKIKLVVIIPVGPNTSSEFLADTLESISFYCVPNHIVILINDSQKELAKRFFKYKVVEVKMTKRMGKEAGLYFSLCSGMDYALTHFDFDVLLRMDDDALITGNKPELEAINYFKKNTNIGMLGSYRVNWENEKRSFADPRNQIQIETSRISKIIKSIMRKKNGDITSLIDKAKERGYELGEHVLGGAYYMSPRLLKKLKKNGLLPSTDLLGSKLQEDHIFSMLTYVVNMKLADFVTGSYPMCLKLKGMPTDPEKVMKLHKKVVHSTRYFGDMREKEIRGIFSKYRK